MALVRRLITIIAVVAFLGAAAAVAALVSRAGTETFRITIVEGLTVDQTLDSLASQTGFTVDELTAPLLDGTVDSDLLPAPPQALRDWEGLLFPDTYDITDRQTPTEILQRLADTAEARVSSVDWTRLEARGLSVHDGIVIASMIEREAAVDADRPLISSVIHNRLEIGMRLQIDATVVYAVGGYPEGGLTIDDLRVDSPYNTYRVDGLPPTPISGAGLASLEAAADPADTGYFFYVLASPDGSHAFAEDYDEFLVLVDRSREAGLIP
jgi:UPF0755 protein